MARCPQAYGYPKLLSTNCSAIGNSVVLGEFGAHCDTGIDIWGGDKHINAPTTRIERLLNDKRDMTIVLFFLPNQYSLILLARSPFLVRRLLDVVREQSSTQEQQAQQARANTTTLDL